MLLWSADSSIHKLSISFAELVVDFEVSSGHDVDYAGNRRAPWFRKAEIYKLVYKRISRCIPTSFSLEILLVSIPFPCLAFASLLLLE